MPLRYQIHCIKRSDFGNHDRRIRSVGGVNADGARWTISEAAAIGGIEAGRWNFYLRRDGNDIEVVIAVSRHGNKYLKGAEDGLHPESLLALPACR